MRDGTVRVWGDNSYGQLGNGTTTARRVPVPVKGLTGVRSLSTRFNTAYALMQDGTVRAWGFSDSGQLGNGTIGGSSIPVRVGVTAGQ